MPKTQAPAEVRLDHETFQAGAMPDVLDERDLEYRPRLQPLPDFWPAPKGRPILTQKGNSCTGHAVAAMVNAVLAAKKAAVDEKKARARKAAAGKVPQVSPYMLYRMARRYDEFPGEPEAGSSLRGALKGWYYHGVLLDGQWPGDPDSDLDLDEDPDLAEQAMRIPLGAFYRVNPFRIDDMQSAILELTSIAVSAAIHEGWRAPVKAKEPDTDADIYVINRADNPEPLGGHAFAIVGYNQLGFVVQNSWGEEWGDAGFATLTYGDWLESAYDAWVARPGVYSVLPPRIQGRLVSTSSGLAEMPGPEIQRLRDHVVNLGNNGRLSRDGRFVSSAKQIEHMFQNMAEYHERWRDKPREGFDKVRRVVLYAHGGLNDEAGGLDIAYKHLNWWLNNQVYPVTFAWQSGLLETVGNQLGDIFGRASTQRIGFDWREGTDRLVEGLARNRAQWVWGEMVENAGKASEPLEHELEWAGDPAEEARVLESPGAAVLVSRLQKYVSEQEAAGESVEVHLAGHSAGSIFLAPLIERLRVAGIPVASLTYLAPAITTQSWTKEVLPHLKSKQVAKFTSFGLSEKRELDDVCGVGGRDFYFKSLLHLVSRALERRPKKGRGSERVDVPLVGLKHHARVEISRGKAFDEVVASVGGELLWAPHTGDVRSNTDSRSHGGFDDDAPTMTSVLVRILADVAPEDLTTYVPNQALIGKPPSRSSRPSLPSPTLVDGSEATDEAGKRGGTGAGARVKAAAAPPDVDGDEAPDDREELTAITAAMVDKGYRLE